MTTGLTKLRALFGALLMTCGGASFAGTHWIADYTSSSPMPGDPGPFYGPMKLHIEFIDSFVPQPNSTFDGSNPIASFSASMNGTIGFEHAWQPANVQFLMTFDSALNATNWFVLAKVGNTLQAATTFNNLLGAGVVDNAFSYRPLKLEDTWSTGIVGSPGVWVLSQVPEPSGLLMGACGLVLLAALSGTRDSRVSSDSHRTSGCSTL